MLMVIFGAGASYDSIPHIPPGHENDVRPPLADQLFENREFFIPFLKSFPEANPIIPLLRQRKAGASVEQVLQGFQLEATGFPDRKRQLAAIRYYLHKMLWHCTIKWLEKANGVTNHLTLVDQIERWRKGNDVCFVTFNYDLLIEDALERRLGLHFQSFRNYTEYPYKLIKLHGSVNWMRDIQNDNILSASRRFQDVACEIIRNIEKIKIGQKYTIVKQTAGVEINSALFPAIAIPVEAKLDFECQKDHIEALCSMVQKVDKILVIGWRASEQPFLELLKKYLRNKVRVLVVTDNKRNSEIVLSRLGAYCEFAGSWSSDNGFSFFTIQREADDFLSKD